MRAGASAFVLKNAAGDELVNAIHEVLQGRTYLTPAVTRDVLEILQSPAGRPGVELTPRQRDVLRLIVEGVSDAVDNDGADRARPRAAALRAAGRRRPS